jgi:hypothetical protein
MSSFLLFPKRIRSFCSPQKKIFKERIDSMFLLITGEKQKPQKSSSHLDFHSNYLVIFDRYKSFLLGYKTAVGIFDELLVFVEFT